MTNQETVLIIIDQSGDRSGGEVKINPTASSRESRGDTIVSLLYAAAAGDISTLKTHKVDS